MIAECLSASVEKKIPQKFSYEVFRRVVASRQPFFRAGLEGASQFLPKSDFELQVWLAHALKDRDAIAFQCIICAAAMAGRKMPSRLLRDGGAAFVADKLMLCWIAWHMQGEVTEELVAAVGEAGSDRPKKALMLLIAAGWWQKFRKGPLPAALVQEARALARLRPVNGESAVLLAGLVSLAPNEALQDLVPCGHDPKILQNAPQLRDGFLAMMNENFEAVVPEKQSHDYNLGRPMRRAVEDIGRNKLCPCESGEKYKRCCEKKDRERLRHSTDVAGKTDMELHDIPHANLSAARLETMPPHELVRLQEVPEELMELYFQRLAECKCFDSLTRIFKRAGVRKEWEAAWKRTFSSIVREWQRKAALRLLKTQRNWKEMLPALEPGVRLLLASRKEKEFLRTLEAEAIAALRSGDEQEIERFASAVVASPYPGLGIFVARSVLPLLEDPKRAASVFDRILHARDRLALSPDDEFGDFMDERALQKKNNHGTQVAAAQAKLSAKAEELRRLKESLATAKRALALQEKREAREAVASTPAKSSEHDEENRKLREKVDWLQAKIREEGAEKLGYLRDLVRLQEELKTVKASPNGSQGPEIQDEEDAGEQLEVSGTQPVRMLEFPKKFEQTLAAFPQHVGRATMAYLGQLAGGEATAFDTVVHLKAYHGVLRKKIAGSHRLLFTLESDRVRVVDLIDRCDLDRRIKKLQAHGLPAA